LGIASFLICALAVVCRSLLRGSTQVVGLRRLSEQEYRNSVADIFGKDIAVQGMFEPQNPDERPDRDQHLGPVRDPCRFRILLQDGRRHAIQVTDEKHRGKLVSCAPKSAKASDDACATEFFSHYGLMLFRRPLTAAELKMRVRSART
jgi:hypothetical protein